MFLDVGGSIGPPSGEQEETTDPDIRRIQSHDELAPLQDIHGRVVGIVAVPVHLPPEKPLSLELPLALKSEELQVRLEEFLTAAAHWNIKEILQALSDHFDQLQFRLLALGLSKSRMRRDMKVKSDSINLKLESTREAVHRAIATHGANRLKRAISTLRETEAKLALLPAWRRLFKVSAHRAQREALQIIPAEVLHHKVAVEFLGGAIQTKFQPESQGANEIEGMKNLQAVIDEMNREEEALNEKIQAIERVRIDLEGMKFPAPN